jgi:hypothetical protein
LVLVAKKKIGNPGSGPDFWHIVKTEKPEPGAYIYNNNNFLIFYIYNIQKEYIYNKKEYIYIIT